MTDSHVANGTTQLMEEGVRLLNFWRLADTDVAHVGACLDMMALPPFGTVVDLGSGIGEFARVAQELRPNLSFTLVNNNQWQLDQSPLSSNKVLADIADTGLPGGAYDAVVLAYALGHGDVVDVLEEAHRLLKPGGVLFLHDIFAPTAAVAEQVKVGLHYAAHNHEQLAYWASLIGFDVTMVQPDTVLSPGPTIEAALPLLSQLDHGVAVLKKSERSHRFVGEKAALQFSGGKDSLACLYLLRPFLRKYITTYWVNAGDGCPETLAVVDTVRQWVPNFVEVTSSSPEWRKTNGIPSDLVPAKAHALGVAYGMNDFAISSRFDCCYNNLMLPLHQRVVADGVTVVVRGTKLFDTGKLPAEGATEYYEVWLPLRDWDHQMVFDYLHRAGAPWNSIYEHFVGISAPECLTCTAWWDDGKAAYLKHKHPEQFQEYRVNLQAIRETLRSHLAELDYELGG